MSAITSTFALVRKDVHSELRTRYALNALVMFVVVAVATIFVASGAALVENNAKRILAYSTFGQLAYVYLGFASMTTVGIVGGLIFLLAHSLAKAGLFLAIGVVEQTTHTKDIRELSGMMRVMPVNRRAAENGIAHTLAYMERFDDAEAETRRIAAEAFPELSSLPAACLDGLPD